METTFITIHDLSSEARILYSSDSIIDILGYTPDEVVNHPTWHFFPEDQLPYARKFHQRRVSMDKAAVLVYCRVRHKDGSWVGCECCFTIVYDVMIVCTSIYSRGLKSQKRAQEAPIVRRIFSSSPRDPRYHMLSHISAKFAQPAKIQQHEPRAALFLNRFTRTLTIMYATNGIQDIIGVPGETMRGRSFYYCIAENCLPDAIKCLENAKANDSIAYLRFWFRDPRVDDAPAPLDEDSDEEMTTNATVSTDNDEGGVGLSTRNDTSPESEQSSNSNAATSTDSMEVDPANAETQTGERTSSGDSMNEGDTHEAIFGHPELAASSTSSIAQSPERERLSPRPTPGDPIELEAVISCTSDGLVVCLRKARPMIPHPMHRPSRPVYENGLFAAPWAVEPMLPPIDRRAGAGFGQGFAPSLGPHGARQPHMSPPRATTGPDPSDYMNAIRDQAIFAWALTGINGALAEYGQGKPLGESLPEEGLPVWASDPRQSAETDPSSNGWHSGREMFGSASRSPEDGRIGAHIFGDPGLDRNQGRSMSSGNGVNGGATPYAR